MKTTLCIWNCNYFILKDCEKRLGKLACFRKSISKSIKTLEYILTIKVQWCILNRRAVIKTGLSKGNLGFGFGCTNNGPTGQFILQPEAGHKADKKKIYKPVVLYTSHIKLPRLVILGQNQPVGHREISWDPRGAWQFHSAGHSVTDEMAKRILEVCRAPMEWFRGLWEWSLSLNSAWNGVWSFPSKKQDPKFLGHLIVFKKAVYYRKKWLEINSWTAVTVIKNKIWRCQFFFKNFSCF